MKEELIKMEWHEDYAQSIEGIFDKYSRESMRSGKPVITKNDFPLVVEDLYNLFIQVHKDRF